MTYGIKELSTNTSKRNENISKIKINDEGNIETAWGKLKKITKNIIKNSLTKKLQKPKKNDDKIYDMECGIKDINYKKLSLAKDENNILNKYTLKFF